MLTWIIVGIVVVVAVVLCFALAIANFSFENFQQKQEELDIVANSARMTTLEYVDTLNKKFFSGKLKIVQANQYEDFYSSGKIGLSQQTMRSNSLASLAVVSHEVGHARQDVEGKLKNRTKLIRRGRLVGVLFTPLLVTAAIFCVLWAFGFVPDAFLWAGCACAGGSVLIFLFSIDLKCREIRNEKQASDYALEFLREFLYEDEVKQCKGLLDSARLTYWAGLLRTLLWWTGASKKGQMFR